ncbi:SET domain protein, sequence [Mycena venus]|uniref:SET domain protein, sequence n=1 Tax=Mycena venus TaxID=2733690 RepID=A0A8H6X3E3_9AGAR|nr:SET domain protein, sequence [Mycena venus]
MYRGMDAIDYEPDASLIDGSDDGIDYHYEVSSSDGSCQSDGGEVDEWGDYGATGSDDYSGDSDDEESKRFAPNNLLELYDRRDWDNEPIPPPRHWCYLGEIVEHITVPIRNVLTVRDKAGKDTHLSTNFDLEAQFDVKVGSTIAILYAENKYFSFGVYGLRLDHAKFVKIFPCNLETLLRINDDYENETPVDSPKKCKGCGKEEEPNKNTLLRCSRCLGASYCGKDCQTDSWKRGHKGECKIFQALIELKRSRDWGRKKPRDWIAFGEREEPRAATPEESDDDSDDESYHFRSHWKDVEPVFVRELQGRFTITSGELLWGQLASILSGLMTAEHDFPSTDDRAVHGGGTVITQGYTYRAPAKVGVWNIVKVNGYGHPDTPTGSWLAYHSSCDPLELLLLARPVSWDTRSRNPRVCWVNRYDWGYHCADSTRAGRFFADIDPDSGWAAASKRQKQLEAAGQYRRKKDPDNERWERLEKYDSHNIFLIDAANGPDVIKLLARPSELETRLEKDKSSSLYNSKGDAEAFGCHLAFIGNDDWEFARLIFGEEESTTFPGKRELVGFWYDADNRYNDSEMTMGRKLGTPVVENI